MDINVPDNAINKGAHGRMRWQTERRWPAAGLGVAPGIKLCAVGRECATHHAARERHAPGSALCGVLRSCSTPPPLRTLAVGEFRRLALLAEADGHLRQKLQQVGGWVGGVGWRWTPHHLRRVGEWGFGSAGHTRSRSTTPGSSPSRLPSLMPPLKPVLTRQVLKLSKEKWDEARDHAMRAVVADNRMRIWCGVCCVCWGGRGCGGCSRSQPACSTDLASPLQPTCCVVGRAVPCHLALATAQFVCEQPLFSPSSPPPSGTPTSPTWIRACCSPAAWAMWTWTDPWVSKQLWALRCMRLCVMKGLQMPHAVRCLGNVPVHPLDRPLESKQLLPSCVVVSGPLLFWVYGTSRAGGFSSGALHHAPAPWRLPIAGLLTKKAQEGAQTTMEATLMAQQTPAQREQVGGLLGFGVWAGWVGSSWWADLMCRRLVWPAAVLAVTCFCWGCTLAGWAAQFPNRIPCPISKPAFIHCATTSHLLPPSPTPTPLPTQVRQLQPQAVSAWWQQGHPGWAIYPVDSEQFLATGTLDSAALPMPTEPMMGAMMAGGLPSFGQPNSSEGPNASSPAAAMPPAMPGAPPMPAAAAVAAAAAFNPAMASAFMGAAGGLPSEALLRAMTPFLHAAPGVGGWVAVAGCDCTVGPDGRHAGPWCDRHLLQPMACQV